MDQLHREERGPLPLSRIGPDESRRASGIRPESRLARSVPRTVRAALATGLLLVAVTACTVTERPPADPRSDAVDGPDTVAGEPDIALIEPMLRSSAGSWNAGDLEGFLDDYLAEPALTFVGSTGILRGIEEVRASYEEGYWASGAPADSLRFEEIEVRPLGDANALATGRWILYRPASSGGDDVTGEGRFSLVLRWQNGQWKILHDHSS